MSSDAESALDLMSFAQGGEEFGAHNEEDATAASSAPTTPATHHAAAAGHHPHHAPASPHHDATHAIEREFAALQHTPWVRQQHKQLARARWGESSDNRRVRVRG